MIRCSHKPAGAHIYNRSIRKKWISSQWHSEHNMAQRIVYFCPAAPNTVSFHVLVILSSEEVPCILVKELILLPWVQPCVLLELIKMSIKDMDFERHPGAHCAMVLTYCDCPGSTESVQQRCSTHLSPFCWVSWEIPCITRSSVSVVRNKRTQTLTCAPLC